MESVCFFYDQHNDQTRRVRKMTSEFWLFGLFFSKYNIFSHITIITD